MNVTDQTRFEAGYKTTPLHFNNGSVALGDLSGQWQTMDMQVSHATQSSVAGHDSKKILLGVQFHQIPLALFDNLTNLPLMKTVQFTNLSLGFGYDHYFDNSTRGLFYMRYQYPLAKAAVSAGSVFTARAQLIFDGSVGLEKKIFPMSWLGFHWYGQYQSFNMDYSDSQTTASGNYSVLFSNAELRWTFEF
jgi:hypothetical protein